VTGVRQLYEGVTRVDEFAGVLARARGSLLDLGCGLGETMRLTPAPLTVVGVDISSDYCRKAAAAGEHTVCADLALPLPFRAATFDWALCSDTFEHLVDPFALAREIRRVLRSEGRLLCHVPNEFSAKSLRQIVRGDGICNRGFFPDAEEWNYPHLRFFSHRGFRRMLERAGFVVETDLTNFGRGWRRRLYPLFGSGPSFVARSVGAGAP
jgi:SAM-dependent methyltransferase